MVGDDERGGAGGRTIAQAGDESRDGRQSRKWKSGKVEK
jgi:hypothetical protein